jgi:FkbM family methyltransferase
VFDLRWLVRAAFRRIAPNTIVRYVEHRRFLASLPPHIRSVIETIRPGDVCIDCGANIGVVARALARYGASVYAFEPDPYAFAQLLKNMRPNENVRCINSAVGIGANDRIKLYFHKQLVEDPIKYSQGSSVMANKPNVGGESIEVDVINLSDFIKDRGRVKLLKIDIEGYETVVVPHLVASRALDCVDHVYVETHDHKWPDLRIPSELMREVVRGSPYSGKIHLDWV